MYVQDTFLVREVMNSCIVSTKEDDSVQQIQVRKKIPKINKIPYIIISHLVQELLQSEEDITAVVIVDSMNNFLSALPRSVVLHPIAAQLQIRDLLPSHPCPMVC